jgi:phosphatidate cytidylyltransferase
LTKSAIKRANLQARLERRQREKLNKTQAPTKAKIQAVTLPISPPISPLKPEVTALHEPVPLSETSNLISDPFPKPSVEEKTNGNGHSVKSTSIASQNDVTPAVTEPIVSPVVQAPKFKPEKFVEPLPLPDSSPKTADRPPNGSPPPQDPEKVKKRQNALTRILWTFIMIGGFIGKPYASFVDEPKVDIAASLTPSGARLYGPSCHAMPNSGVQRSHCLVLSENCVTGVSRCGTLERQRSLEQNT